MKHPEEGPSENKNYIVGDGLLFHSSGGILRQRIASKERQNPIIVACHMGNLGEHLGGDIKQDTISARGNFVKLYICATRTRWLIVKL